MHKFQSLKVWQRSMELAANIYIVTKEFPIDERFGLVSQLRKCSVSIPSNIAEGSGRNTNKQFQYFLEIAMGSCNELMTQIELAKRFGYLYDEAGIKILGECSQIQKMIQKLHYSLG